MKFNMSNQTQISAYVKRKTFFTCMKVQFPDVENSRIVTELFLEGAKEVVGLIEQLGKIFAPVKYDMNNNILRVESVYQENKLKYKYLQDMLLYEKESKNSTTINALMWLRRALHFVSKFFELIIVTHRDDKKSDSLHKIFNSAYEETLMPYHGWVTQQLFNILCKICLSREQFYQILSCNEPNCDDDVISDMENFNVNLKNCISNLASFYKEHQLETLTRV